MPTFEIILLVVLGLAGLGVLGWIYRKDLRYLKRKTSETMSKTVRLELDRERAGMVKRRRAFETLLDRAKGNKGGTEITDHHTHN